MFSSAALRARARDGKFWKRFLRASALGYVYCVSGFALAFSLLGTIHTLIKYPPENLFWGLAGFVLTVPHIALMTFLVGSFGAVLPFLSMLPITALSALTLLTKKSGTLIFGAVIGALVGARVTLGDLPTAASMGYVMSCAGAGTMTALALWKFCLRH